MQLNELVDVLDYLDRKFKSGKLIALYDELIAEIKQFSNSNSKYGEKIIAEKIELLKGYLLDIVPQDWRAGKWAIFISIGGEKLLGKASLDKIERISKTPVAGYGVLLKELQEVRKDVESFAKWTSQLLAELQGISDVDQSEMDVRDISQDDLVLKLIFKDRMKMKVMNQTVKFLSMWEKIFYYVSRLTKQKPKDVRINVIGPDSDSSDILIVEVIYNKITVAAIVRCVIQAYDLYSNTLEIRKKILEIRKLKLENKEIEKALAGEEKSMIGRIAETITANQMKEYAWKEEDFQKISKAVAVALKYILDYIERGGEVDFYGSSVSEEHQSLHEALFAARDQVINLKLDVALLQC